jgi:hypothetical protein
VGGGSNTIGTSVTGGRGTVYEKPGERKSYTQNNDDDDDNSNTTKTESFESKIGRGGGFNKGGLIARPKKKTKNKKK